MNTTQIQYFIAAARYLNFTVAARELHITQPALSKQIHALEKELNMVLFLINKKSVSLTPAGKILLKELPLLEEHYEEILHQARIVNEGMIGEVKMAILEGQMVGEAFKDIFAGFVKEYSNISVRLHRDSFKSIRKQLFDGDIDIAVSLEMDIINHPELSYEVVDVSRAIVVVSKDHPVRQKNITGWADLSDETFILIDPSDCKEGSQLVYKDCIEHGFIPNVRYAPSLETVMLWVEAGLGIGIVNTTNSIVNNPQIHILDGIVLEETKSVLVWREKKLKPSARVFVEYYLDKIRSVKCS